MRHVVHDNVQLAIISRIQKVPEPALISTECLIPTQSKKDSAANTSNADHSPEWGAFINMQVTHEGNSSQFGFSEMGCPAVSSVAVIKASGCRWRRVIGYSGVGSEKSATRSAVCFHDPVSL